MCEVGGGLCIYKSMESRLMSGSFFFQAEDGIRDLVRSRGLGDVYKRQVHIHYQPRPGLQRHHRESAGVGKQVQHGQPTVLHRLLRLVRHGICLLYTSDAADDLLCVDLGGRRIIKKKIKKKKKKNKNNKKKHFTHVNNDTRIKYYNYKSTIEQYERC
mgnify:CR=1 FL=1